MRGSDAWAAAFAAAALTLTGCSSQNNEWGQYFHLMRQSIGGSLHTQSISRAQASAIPYASLGYRVNGSDEAILVLATDTSGEQLWTAASHIVLLTRDGRIARTVGLPHDLGGTTPKNAGAVPPLSDSLKAPYRSSRTVDLPDLGAYAITLDCVTTARGSQTITIIGAALPTVKVDETCRNASLNWSFTDNYWLDAKTGFVWHSVQHVHPSVIVQTEIFRPPG